MPTNPERRAALTDAGLAILAEEGARGLTHRAVDDRAGFPRGTASNYFRSRDALLEALVARIGERLAPDPAVIEPWAHRRPGRALMRDYVGYIVERLTREREVTLALFELRLEAARRPEVEQLLGTWLREGFAADVAFHRSTGMAGGRREIALFHYALDGLLLDRLTTSIDAATSTDAVVRQLVDRLMPAG